MEALFEETWHRPFPRLPFGSKDLEGKLTLLAEEDEPVGIAVADLLPNRVAHLNVIYVVPERRRQGVARALLDGAIRYALAGVKSA